MKKALAAAACAAIALCVATFSASAAAWTTMIYMAGDNTLDRYADQSLEWMRRGAASSDNNVLILVSSRVFSVGGVEVDSDTLKCYRASGNTLVAVPLASINPSWPPANANLGDPSYLVNFATYCAAAYPADKYLLVVWSHANGWWPKAPSKKAIAYDDHNATGDVDYITTLELGSALAAIKSAIGKKIDVFAADACLMAQIETAYQIRNSVDYIVASQELTPAPGWRYDLIFDYLAANPSAPALAASGRIAEIYDETYGPGSTLIDYDKRTMSVIAAAELDALAARLKEFSDELKNVLRTRLLFLARDKVEYFGGRENYKFGAVDLYDLAYLIRSTREWNMPRLETAAAAVMSAVEKAVPRNLSGPCHPRSKGISINHPKTRDDYLSHNNPPTVSTGTTGNYDALDFAQATGWNTYLKFYTEQIPVFAITGLDDVVAAPAPFNPGKEPLKFLNFPSDISDLKIKIYDLAGRAVRILDEESVEVFSGEGYALWNGLNEAGRDAAPGIYFWRVSSSYGSCRGRIYLIRQ